MKKIILRSIVIILVILNIFVMYLLSQPQNNKVLEDIKVVDLKNDKSIAIMVQDTEGDNWHEASNRDSWPDPSTHGYVGAECTDSDGAKIDVHEILQFDLSNYTAEINTKNSIYCTLYFAKGRPLLQALKETKGTTLNIDAAVDGMYRYKGTAAEVTNNYICFGTTDKEECLKAADKYMYRIIGITSEADNTINLPANSLKIIKATPSSESQKWHSSYKNDTKWDASLMKTYLNETFYNATFVTEGTRILNASYWDSIILSHKWYNADQKYDSFNLTVEPKTSQTEESKIGLMYATDYKNSGSTNTGNWLYLKNGWSTNSTLSGNTSYEWTMSRLGAYSDRTDLAWYVMGTNGTLDNRNLAAEFSVRPVFCLQSELNLTGQGTVADPFRITTKNNA